MNLLIISFLLTGVFSTPIDQGRQFRDETRNADGSLIGQYGYQDPSGALRIVKYTAGKSGIMANNIGIPMNGPQPGQPMVWSGQPIIVQQSPLSYIAVKGGSPFMTERDQQKYMTVEDETESREEDEETSADIESRPDTDENVEPDSNSDTDPKSAENDSEGSSPVVSTGKTQKTQVVSSGNSDNDQTFPQVVSGKRRLVESQQGVKGGVVQPSYYVSPIVKKHIVYHTVQQGIPVGIQQRIPITQTQVINAIKSPQIQYTNGLKYTSPVQVSHVLQPVTVQQLGNQRQVQYVYQPIGAQNIGLDQNQVLVQSVVGQQSGIKGLGVNQKRVVTVQGGVGQTHVMTPIGVQQIGTIQQRHDIQSGADQRQVQVVGVGQQSVVDQRQVGQNVGVVTDQRQIPVIQSGVQGIENIRVIQQTVQPMTTVNDGQTVGIQYVVPNQRQSQKVVVQNPSGQIEALVLNPYSQNTGYQLIQPAQQYMNQFEQIPISDIQNYYQTVRDTPLQYGQQIGNQYTQQIGNISPIQTIQPIQYSGIQGVQQVSGMQTVQTVHPIRQSNISVGRKQTVSGTKSK